MEIQTIGDLENAADLLTADRSSEWIVGVPERVVAIALFRLGALRRLWKMERENHYKDRCKLVQRVVNEIKHEDPRAPISISSMATWEAGWRSFGVRGLFDGRGGQWPKTHKKQESSNEH